MISALELKNKLERFDKNTPLLDYNVWFGFLPAIILFPLFVILNNAHTESLILNSPFLLGFGFAGIFMASLVLVTGGLLITHFSLSRYIAIKSGVRRFNANSLLEDDSLAHGISTKIWEFLKIHRKHDPLYQADLEKKADKTEVDDWKKLTSDFIKRFTDHFATKAEVRELRKEVKDLRLWKEAKEREEDEKELEIGEKAHTHNNTENTKSLDKSNKIEFLDE